MAKGSQFERDICRQLSLWWTQGDRDDIFWRSSNSGGRATARGKSGKKTGNAHGDIAATDPVGYPLLKILTFELKRGYNRNTIHDMIDRPEGAAVQGFETFIQQAALAAENAGSWSWAIIHRRDRRNAILWIDDNVVNRITNHIRIGCTRVRLSLEIKTVGRCRIHGFLLEKFLNAVPPSIFHKLLREGQDA